MKWLEERIIWESVDGQHVVAACKAARERCKNGTLNRAEYEETYMKRKSTFVVYDDPRLYILMSLMLYSATHRDRHLSTMAENLQKLRQIWIHYGRPSSLIRAHDDRRAIALVSTASAVRKLPPIDDDATITTKVLARILVDLTHQAWHPSDECFEAILQVCKDYENGFL